MQLQAGAEMIEMFPGEQGRREEQAVRDIAATALYHANRLPLDSRLRRSCIKVHELFTCTAVEPAEIKAPTVSLVRPGYAHLKMVK